MSHDFLHQTPLLVFTIVANWEVHLLTPFLIKPNSDFNGDVVIEENRYFLEISNSTIYGTKACFK